MGRRTLEQSDSWQRGMIDSMGVLKSYLLQERLRIEGR
jgi:hypothetical protein